MTDVSGPADSLWCVTVQSHVYKHRHASVTADVGGLVFSLNIFSLYVAVKELSGKMTETVAVKDYTKQRERRVDGGGRAECRRLYTL